MAHEHKPTGPIAFTCPMHPEMRQYHPGTCPKCEMTLVQEGSVDAVNGHASAHGPKHGHSHGHTHGDLIPGNWTI